MQQSRVTEYNKNSIKIVRSRIQNNGIYMFPNGTIRHNMCFVIAIHNALKVNNIVITKEIEQFLNELAEMIVELFMWNCPVNTYNLYESTDINRFSDFLTEHFQKYTKCRLGIVKSHNAQQIVFGEENTSLPIIWIVELNLAHFEAVQSWF